MECHGPNRNARRVARRLLPRPGGLLALALVLCASAPAAGDPPPSYVPVGGRNASLLTYLITRGDVEPRFILRQPYLAREVLPGLEKAGASPRLAHWARLARYDLDPLLPAVEQGNASFAPEVNFCDTLLAGDGSPVNHYRYDWGGVLTMPRTAAGLRVAMNRAFIDDPLYPGDVSESDWIYARVEDAYLALELRPLRFFLGRMKRNWGAPESPGLLLSDHPYSYDHVGLEVASRRLALSWLFTRLDDMEGAVDTQNLPDTTITATRYLAVHRLDFVVAPWLQAAFSEAFLYGGDGVDPYLQFLNPLNNYYGSQRNDGVQGNAFYSLDIYVKPSARTAAILQLLLDDFVINNDTEDTTSGRDIYPDRLGVQATLQAADLLLPGLFTRLAYVRVWNDTYLSFRTWENLIVRGKSLGYPETGVEAFTFDGSYWSGSRWTFRWRASAQRSGNRNLNMPFPAHKDPFPAPPVQRSLTTEVGFRYVPDPVVSLGLQTGATWFRNRDNVEGRNERQFRIMLDVALHWVGRWNDL